MTGSRGAPCGNHWTEHLHYLRASGCFRFRSEMIRSFKHHIRTIMTAHWMRLAETGMVTDGNTPACCMLHASLGCDWLVFFWSFPLTWHTVISAFIHASCSLDPYHWAQTCKELGIHIPPETGEHPYRQKISRYPNPSNRRQFIFNFFLKIKTRRFCPPPPQKSPSSRKHQPSHRKSAFEYFFF